MGKRFGKVIHSNNATNSNGRIYRGRRDALEGKGPQRRPRMRLGRRLEEVATAVGDGYCRLQTPLRLALAVRGTVAGQLGALEGGVGGSPPSNATLRGGGGLYGTNRGWRNTAVCGAIHPGL